MSDTISRQAAIDAIAHATFDVTIVGGRRGFIDYKKEFEKAFVAIRDKYIEALEALPSAQPEIIRCKDCRYYQDNNDGYPHINCKWDANETPDADDFCSGAERRTDED